MSDFLTDSGVVVALLCAALAVVYGVVTARSLLALSPGNETMQRISGAVQKSARAISTASTVIAVVGAVLFVVLIVQDISVAAGFAVGGCCPARPATSA